MIRKLGNLIGSQLLTIVLFSQEPANIVRSTSGYNSIKLPINGIMEHVAKLPPDYTKTGDHWIIRNDKFEFSWEYIEGVTEACIVKSVQKKKIPAIFSTDDWNMGQLIKQNNVLLIKNLSRNKNDCTGFIRYKSGWLVFRVSYVSSELEASNIIKIFSSIHESNVNIQQAIKWDSITDWTPKTPRNFSALVAEIIEDMNENEKTCLLSAQDAFSLDDVSTCKNLRDMPQVWTRRYAITIEGSYWRRKYAAMGITNPDFIVNDIFKRVKNAVKNKQKP